VAIDKQKVSAAAQKYIEKGNFDRAIRELQRLVDDDPSDDRTLLKIGNVQHRKGDLEAAAKTYWQVAQLYKENGAHQKAIAVFKQLAQIQPDRADVNEAVGALLHAQGLTHNALAEYRDVFERYKAANDLEGCRRALEAMVRIDPENVGLRVKYAEHMANIGKVDAAIKQFSMALAQLEAKTRFDDYIKVAERYLYHKPDDSKLLKKVVTILLQEERARQALAKLQTLYTSDPQDVETLELLIATFIALSQDAKAVSVLKEVARVYEHLEPGNPKATEAWQRAFDIDPEDPEVKLALQMGDETDMPMLGESVVMALDADDVIAEVLPRGEQVSLRSPGLDRAEEIDRLLSECEMNLGYNLIDKATEQVHAVLLLDAYNLPARRFEIQILRAQARFGEAALRLRALARESWEQDKDLALELMREAAILDPDNPDNFNTVLSFGIDPAAFGFAPAGAAAAAVPKRPPPPPTAFAARPVGQAPPPVPQVVAPQPQPLPQVQFVAPAASLLPPPTHAAQPDRPFQSEGILLQNWDIAPHQSGLPQPIKREPISTLPASAFELLDEDEGETPAEAPPALSDEESLGFDLDNLDQVLHINESVIEESQRAADDEFQALFSDEDFDQLFNDELLQSSLEMELGDADIEVSDEDFEVEEIPNDATPAAAMLPAEELQMLADFIDELDFYIAQGLFDEAAQAIESLVQRFGDHPLVVAAQNRLALYM